MNIDYEYIISKMKYADKANVELIRGMIENAWNSVYTKPIYMVDGLNGIRDNELKDLDNDSITALEILSFCLAKIYKSIGQY